MKLLRLASGITATAVLCVAAHAPASVIDTFDANGQSALFESAKLDNKFNGNNFPADEGEIRIQDGGLETGGTFGNTSTVRDQRMLIRVDISSIASSREAIGGSLLVVGRPNTVVANSDFTVELHRVTTDWVEGAVTSPPTGGDGNVAVSWSDSDGFDNPGDWTNDGGDFGSTPIDTFDVAAGTTSSSRFDMLFDLGSAEGLDALNDWIDDPAQNFGFLLRIVADDDSVDNRIDVRNVETGVTGQRPVLTVETIPEPGSMMLLGAGAACMLMRRR